MVKKETVHIALTMVVLHDLEVKAADVLNTYVIACSIKKLWTVLGPEFEDDAGKSAIIVRALYGLKSADVVFRAHHAQCIQELGYKSCDAHLYLWMSEDKLEYYSYIFHYVNNTLCIQQPR